MRWYLNFYIGSPLSSNLYTVRLVHATLCYCYSFHSCKQPQLEKFKLCELCISQTLFLLMISWTTAGKGLRIRQTYHIALDADGFFRSYGTIRLQETNTPPFHPCYGSWMIPPVSPQRRWWRETSYLKPVTWPSNWCQINLSIIWNFGQLWTDR